VRIRRSRANRRVDRDRRVARRRTLRRTVKAAIVAVILGGVGVQGLRMADAREWLSPFRVRDVRVVGARVADPRVLVAEAGLMGRPVSWWSSLGAYTEQVVRDPLVASARFERGFPNRLTLVVEERWPIAHVELDRLTPVDPEGRVLPVSSFQEGWDAPVFALGWEEKVALAGGRLKPGPVLEAVTWLSRVRTEYPALYSEISAIDLAREGTLTLRLVHTEGVIVLDRTTPIEKLALVDDVIRDLREKGVDYLNMDLRFEDQIIVKKG
jgi:cell division septal protein FtsQ